MLVLMREQLRRRMHARLAGKVHVRNTIEQLKLVGPRSLGVALLTAGFVGMVFTIQARAGLLKCTASQPMLLRSHASCLAAQRPCSPSQRAERRGAGASRQQQMQTGVQDSI